MKPKHIFIIGPGGVGKTTSGSILSKKLNIPFIDLDQEFMEKIANIGKYINDYSYKQYCIKNSELFYSILENCNEPSIIVLSSGFLVYENIKDLITKHKETLKECGVSVCLLPSESLNESVNIVVNRQLVRGFGLEEESEKKKFMDRYHKYNNAGDIQIYSTSSPEDIANDMLLKLLKSKNSKKVDTIFNRANKALKTKQVKNLSAIL